MDMKGMRKETNTVLRKYRTLFSEYFPDILEYFEKMENDEKPSVHLELWKEPLIRKRHFKKALEKLSFYVYESDYHNFSVSKIPSIAYWLRQMENDGFYNNSGAVGILLGYPLKEVYKYVERTKEEKVLRESTHDK
jgi:hypothetical protein